MKYTIALLALFLTTCAFAQSPLGTWKSVDDKTGEAKSQIEIYEQNGRLFGKVIKILRADAADRRCTECDGARKNQPIQGMVIIEDLQAKGEYWKGGTILDPENGNTYKCSIWFEDGNTDQLQVRGKHWTGLYRTQTWYRLN